MINSSTLCWNKYDYGFNLRVAAPSPRQRKNVFPLSGGGGGGAATRRATTVLKVHLQFILFEKFRLYLNIYF